MTAADLLARDASEQAALVRAGDASARELVDAALREIERLDRTLNAFVALCPERALAEADAVRAGDPRPLCGVPVAIKDLLSATEGLPTTHGTRALGDWHATHDAAHVRRLRAAGAIVVGKTNSPELGLRPVTENARFGATRNPWNPSLSPGGSSGGSAAAVASGMVALADGSDLGGSLRIPAACCGLVALKPSRGRLPLAPEFGDIAAGPPTYGVLTRTVYDTATALDAIAADGHHAAPPPGTLADATRRPPGRLPVRVASTAPLGIPVDDEARNAAQRAALALAELGHDVDEHTPNWDDERFPASWATYVTGGMQHLIRVLERLHGRHLDAGQLEPATRAWLVDTPPVTPADILQAGERLNAFAHRLLAAWPPDTVLLTPTLTRLPAPIGTRPGAGVTDDAARFSALVRIWNVTGQPAITLPLHESHDGVPVGAQLIAAPDRDHLLLSLAAQLEESAEWLPRRPAR